MKPPVTFLDVVAGLNDRQRLGIGRGAPDAPLLKGFDQSGFRVAGRWTGKTLVDLKFTAFDALPFRDARQLERQGLVVGIAFVLSFLIDR